MESEIDTFHTQRVKKMLEIIYLTDQKPCQPQETRLDPKVRQLLEYAFLVQNIQHLQVGNLSLNC